MGAIDNELALLAASCGAPLALSPGDLRQGPPTGGLATLQRRCSIIRTALTKLNASSNGGGGSQINDVIVHSPVGAEPYPAQDISTAQLNKKIRILPNGAPTTGPPFPIIAYRLPDPMADAVSAGDEVILETPYLPNPSALNAHLFEAEDPSNVDPSSDPANDYPPLRVGITLPNPSVGGIEGFADLDGDGLPPELIYDPPVGGPYRGWMSLKLRVMTQEAAGGRRDWCYVSNDYQFLSTVV